MALAAYTRRGYYRRMIFLLGLLLAVLIMACSGAGSASPTPLPHTATPARTAQPTETSRPQVEATEQPVAAPSETPEGIVGPLVNVGAAIFAVELAITITQHVQGLSDRSSLAPGTGMLFVNEQQRKLTFWMKDMHFPLDMVWIGSDCTVVNVTPNVPPPLPGQTENDLPRYSSGVPAQYVLEVNGGEAVSWNIAPGDPVEFSGTIAGQHGC